MGLTKLILGALLAVSFAPTAQAADDELPYWVTLTADKVNMRVGPAPDYAIRWVYVRDGLPLKVVRLHEGWRLVEDPDGARGWMLARFLSRSRGAQWSTEAGRGNSREADGAGQADVAARARRRRPARRLPRRLVQDRRRWPAR